MKSGATLRRGVAAFSSDGEDEAKGSGVVRGSGDGSHQKGRLGGVIRVHFHAFLTK